MPTEYKPGSGYYTLNPSTFKFIPMNFGELNHILHAAMDRYTKLIFDTPVPFYATQDHGPYLGELVNMVLDVHGALQPQTNESCECFASRRSFYVSLVLPLDYLLVGSGEGGIAGYNVYGVMHGKHR